MITTRADFSVFLLDFSLTDYLTSAVQTVEMCQPSPVVDEIRRKALALITLLYSLLDPTVKDEVIRKEFLDRCNSYLYKAIDYQHMPTERCQSFRTVTCAQQVMSLPEIVTCVLSHLSLDDGLLRMNTTSKVFYGVISLVRWCRPFDLDSVKKQLRFCWSLATSEVSRPGAGFQITRLRLRVFGDGWNGPLIQKILELTPSVSQLAIHWGDPDDTPVAITTEHISFFRSILAPLVNLTNLSLLQFSEVFDSPSDTSPPEDAHLPFTRLRCLEINQFDWYWKNIAAGTGSTLDSLSLGHATKVGGDRIVALIQNLPSLTCLRIDCDVELHHIQQITTNAPQLQRLHIAQYHRPDQAYAEGVIRSLIYLPWLRAFTLNLVVGWEALSLLLDLPCTLEDLSLMLGGSEDAPNWVIRICERYQDWLTSLRIVCSPPLQIETPANVLEAISKAKHLKEAHLHFASRNLTE